MAENIDFRLNVIDDKLGKVLDDNEKKAKSLGSALTVAIGSFAGGAALKAVELLGRGFGELTNFIGDSVQAAAESEAALNKLQFSLASTNQLTEENVKSFQDFANGIQATTAFEDDAVIANAALLQSLARLDTEGLKRATSAAVDLAATLGVDLETATRIVAKAAEGNTAALGKLGIEFRKGVTDAETFNNVLAALEGRFGGSAQAQAKTFSGAVTQLGNVFDDLQENVGSIITQSPAVIAAFNVIKNIMLSLGNSINSAFGGENSDAITNFFRLIFDGSALIVISADAIGRAFTIAVDVAMIAIRTLALGIVTPIAGALELISIIPGIGESFKGAASAATEEMNRLSTSLQGNIQSIDNSINGETFLSGLSDTIAEKKGEFESLVASISTGSETIKNSTAPVENVEDSEAAKRVATLNNEILALDEQFFLAREQLAFENDLAERERFAVKTEQDLAAIAEFETRKSEIALNAALASADLVADQKEKDRLKEKAILENSIKDQAIRAKLENDINKLRVANQKDTLSTISTLSESNNKTLAAIGKAAGITQIAIDTPVAISKALAAFPPPFNFVAATAVGAAMAAQAARIAGVQFANGGIVGGNVGATNGPDNTTATIRNGEMVLNANQQKSLFDAINGGTLGGRDIVIQINSREIARAVRDEINSGFRLA